MTSIMDLVTCYIVDLKVLNKMDKTMIISKPTSTAVSKCFINFCITSIFILMIMAQAEQAVANVLQ